MGGFNMYINCKSNSYQLRFSESFNSISNTASSKKDTVIDILSKHLDLSSIIPPEFHFSYNSNRGADRFYSLKSMLSALILQKILGFNKTSQLIDLLHISKEVRDFCTFDKVPNKSQFSRFKTTFHAQLENLFNSLVIKTEPICRKLGENFASHLILDTSGIEPYVAENNKKFFNKILKQVKNQNKGKSKEDLYKIAYSLMPSSAAANSNIKLMYINGSFNYAYKFAILTNAHGIVRHISFADDIFVEKHPEIAEFQVKKKAKNKPAKAPVTSDTLFPLANNADNVVNVISNNQDSLSPDEDKSIGDSNFLEPVLSDFFSVVKRQSFNFHTFLADSAFDKIALYPTLMNTFGFKRVAIPINPRNSKPQNNSENKDFFINENGIPVCKKYNILFKDGHWVREKGRTPRHKWLCPKAKYNGKKRTCICETPCSDKAYGKTTYTYDHLDLRINPGIQRGSDKFRKVYKRRVVVERTIHSFKDSLAIGDTFQQNQYSIKSDLFLAGITQLLNVLIADKMAQLKNFKSFRRLLKSA